MYLEKLLTKLWVPLDEINGQKMWTALEEAKWLFNQAEKVCFTDTEKKLKS